MIFLAVVTFELIFLYIISRKLTQNLYTALFLLFRNRPAAISVISVLYFPGTIVHELAHMFVAEILQVRTSGLTLVPEGLENTEVKTGSVMITKTDPFRRAIIGVAPVFVGLGLLGLISYYIPQLWQQTLLDAQNNVLFSSFSVYCLLFTVYSLFAVSNTMFSSKEDMEGFWPVALFVVILGFASYAVGIRISLTNDMWSTLSSFFRAMAINVGWVTGLNVVLFFLSKLTISAVEKITKRKLIHK